MIERLSVPFLLIISPKELSWFQCIQGLPEGALRRIILTASGGAFRCDCLILDGGFISHVKLCVNSTKSELRNVTHILHRSREI